MSRVESASRAAPRPEYEVIFEHRRCDGSDTRSRDGRCRRIVTHWAQPKGYRGPVYCRDHDR